MIQFQSSRGLDQVGFEDVLLNGLAPDGGLYSPLTLPEIDLAKIHSFQDAVTVLLDGFAPGWLGEAERDQMILSAYGQFRGDDICPVKPFETNIFLLDLTLGPTFAFKDFALSLLGSLLDKALAGRGQTAVVVGATSGDTGSAAIQGLKSAQNVRVVMLHPQGRVSETQRRQMTTVGSESVTNLAVKGSFDDCQNLVKKAFTDSELRKDVNLVAVNSINFARVLIQIGYYLKAVKELASKSGGQIDVVVPTGNFGNVLSAWYAKKLGAPIADLVVATNPNDSFTRFLDTGQLDSVDVKATASPSMDIQIPSNLERLIWEVSGRDSDAVADLFSNFRSGGKVQINSEWLSLIRSEFTSCSVSDEDTIATIAETYSSKQILIDPHTAVGVAAAGRHATSSERVMLVCETASPGKFSHAMHQALGFAIELPAELSALYYLDESFDVVPPDFEILASYLRG